MSLWYSKKQVFKENASKSGHHLRSGNAPLFTSREM